MDNMDSEIAMMFIRNCPDANLACVFKCKPISKWSLIEVQEAIDEHQREHQAKRSVSNMHGDRWIPVRMLNTSSKSVTLRRNTKIAEVSACIAIEDLDEDTEECESLDMNNQSVSCEQAGHTPSQQDTLAKLGLESLDIDSCEVSPYWKSQLMQLVQKYEDTSIPPSSPGQYHKLREVLSEMEELAIIRKSNSEWASPLVLVWKKNGDLRICVDYRWLNARTIKDAHPLPHQADCLAALGGSAIFSAMDLTSGFYNIAMAEEDKKLTAFTTPMGLYEFNRLPQGLCNSPASFMRLMMNIFGDQNFMTLLCYLDDVLVYAPGEAEALKRLEMVFSRLRAHGLKLAPKKCQLLRRSVKFLGHVVDGHGVRPILIRSKPSLQ
ncbi:hypothetical protein WMY93_031394 [Mugilogobius chulae]|uniref:ribonuclease H n=1 Tax=Mugilogobius chulae TaxID=88201 RepID=A0AAW0MHY6_9GOBI